MLQFFEFLASKHKKSKFPYTNQKFAYDRALQNSNKNNIKTNRNPGETLADPLKYSA